ncbi:class I SAM-dependent methyltransferase [Neiella marina]|uniref:Class I SAM-dependent methyltransferase n=1 Tax=Neiella holothuriorum TaxID=2870530 RepID=A0ABS7EEQ8_9GAMM|nr:class I SAM-dependent methyltransferase [Neiella holothuriorum]MBW8190824.1 class I SAM-dependent methyltransferase [Neiella holothuriorum]
MTEQASSNWERFYNDNAPMLYPTEWVMRTLAGAKYPNMKLDKRHYKGASILDLSTGDGRNLELLHRLGFNITATEISEPLVASVKRNMPANYQAQIKFEICFNHDLPFADSSFDYFLSCSSLYYLNDGVEFDDILTEAFRIIKPSGYLIFSLPTIDNSVLANAQKIAPNRYTITNDPHGLRNGIDFFVIHDEQEIADLLEEHCSHVAIGHEATNYYGLNVSCYYVVCQKQA